MYAQTRGGGKCSVVTPQGLPRSSTEAAQFLGMDTGPKFRQLPCRTFLSSGSCPYIERCVYLHDPRLASSDVKNKCRRKNKEVVVLDAFFWPCMPGEQVASYLHENKQPSVSQPYEVPLPDGDLYRRHDEAMYSMWMHFCDFCATLDGGGDPIAKKVHLEETAAKAQAIALKHPQDSHLYNVHTDRKRLACFTNIKSTDDSNGKFATSKSSSSLSALTSVAMIHRPVSLRAGPSPSSVTPTVPIQPYSGLETWLLTPPTGPVFFTDMHPSFDQPHHRNEIQQPIREFAHSFVPISGSCPLPYDLRTFNPFASEMASFGPPQLQHHHYQHHLHQQQQQQQQQQPVPGLFPPHRPTPHQSACTNFNANAPTFIPCGDIGHDVVGVLENDNDRFGLDGAFSGTGLIDTMLQNLPIDELGEGDHDASDSASAGLDKAIPATLYGLFSSSSAMFPSTIISNCSQPHQPEQPKQQQSFEQLQEAPLTISTGACEGSSKASLFPWLRAVQSNEQNFIPVTPERRERSEKNVGGVPSPVSIIASVKSGADSPDMSPSFSSFCPPNTPMVSFFP